MTRWTGVTENQTEYVRVSESLRLCLFVAEKLVIADHLETGSNRFS